MFNEQYPDAQLKPLQFRGKWFKTRCYVEDNRILPVSDAKIEEYNPFDYYENKKDDMADSPLYIQFANWDFSNPRNIEEFCSKWGTLGLGYRLTWARWADFNNPLYNNLEKYRIKKPLPEGVRARKLEPWDYAEPVDEFLQEASKFKWTLLAGSALRDNDYEMQKKLLEEKGINDISSISNIKEILTVSFLNSINHYLSYIIPFIVAITDENQFYTSLNWEFHSLIDVLYMMLALDFQKGKYIRICKSSTCSKIFVTDRQDKIYCSRECALRQADREYKKRVRRNNA